MYNINKDQKNIILSALNIALDNINKNFIFEKDVDKIKLAKEIINNLEDDKHELPFDYDDKKDSFMNSLENLYMIDTKLMSFSDIEDKIDKSIDNFTKYILDNE